MIAEAKRIVQRGGVPRMTEDAHAYASPWITARHGMEGGHIEAIEGWCMRDIHWGPCPENTLSDWKELRS